MSGAETELLDLFLLWFLALFILCHRESNVAMFDLGVNSQITASTYVIMNATHGA